MTSGNDSRNLCGPVDGRGANTPPNLSNIHAFGAFKRFKCFFGPRAYNRNQKFNETNNRWHIYSASTRIKLLGVMFSPFKIIAVCVSTYFYPLVRFLFSYFHLCAVFVFRTQHLNGHLNVVICFCTFT